MDKLSVQQRHRNIGLAYSLTNNRSANITIGTPMLCIRLLLTNKARITASLIQCYAPTQLVAPSAVSIADAIDAMS